MWFAQIACLSWPPSLSGPGPVVLQVRPSPPGGFLTNDQKQLCYVEPNLVKPFLLQGMS